MTLIERMYERLVAMIYGIVRYSTVAENSADGTTDKVAGHPGNPDEQATHEEARRFQAWGVRSRPPKGVEAIVLRVGGGATNGVQVAHESGKYGPTNLNDGEVAIYCKASGTQIVLDQNGGITITGASGQNVNVNVSGGGAVNIAGSGHPMLLADVLLSDLQAFVSTMNTILQAGTAGGPTKQVIVQAAQLALTQLYTRLQSGGAAYKSTVANNG